MYRPRPVPPTPPTSCLSTRRNACKRSALSSSPSPIPWSSTEKDGFVADGRCFDLHSGIIRRVPRSLGAANLSNASKTRVRTRSRKFDDRRSRDLGSMKQQAAPGGAQVRLDLNWHLYHLPRDHGCQQASVQIMFVGFVGYAPILGKVGVGV